jgi:hypothetical protein
MSLRTILSAAKKLAVTNGFDKGLKQATQEGFDEIAKHKTQLAGMAGLGGTAAAMSAQATGAMDFTDANTPEGQAVRTIGTVGATLGGALASHRAIKMAGRVIRKQPWKRTGVTESFMGLWDNTLMPNVLAPAKKASFYGGQQIQAVVEEAYSATKRAGKVLIDPKASAARKRTGLNVRQVELMDEFDKLLKEEKLNMAQMQFKKGQRGYVGELKSITDRIKQGMKVLHHKYVNDFSNSGIFNEYFDQTGPLSDYVRRFLLPTTYDNLVSQVGKPFSIGKEALTNMLKVQGFKTPVANMKYLQLNNKGVRMGDMLRDIQFDPRAYKLFGKMQKATKDSKLDFFKEAKALFPNTKKLKSGKLQIILSPQFKSNFDWGGSAGSIIWDPRKAKKIQFFGTDGRDLFGMKLGDDVINVSPIKEVRIPKVLKAMRKNARTRGPDKVKRRKMTKQDYAETTTEEIDKFVTKSKMVSKDDYETLQKVRSTYKAELDKPLSAMEMVEFTGTRAALVAGGVGGFYGAYALADD